MAQLGNFNADPTQGGVAPSSGLDPIPVGVYKIMMRASQWKPTKAKDGHYLECEYVVMEGPYSGRKLFDRLNLRNKSTQAVEIAKGTLSAMCHAAGVLQVQDSSQLHNIPMMVEVKIRPAQGNYDANNEIRKYLPAGAQPSAPIGAPPSAPQDAPNPAQAMPMGAPPAAPVQEAIPMGAPPAAAPAQPAPAAVPPPAPDADMPWIQPPQS